MKKKQEMLTPKKYAALHGVGRSTVMDWLNAGLLKKATSTIVGGVRYWAIPANAPRPVTKRGAPKKGQNEKIVRVKTTSQHDRGQI